eukprot:scaffold52469_cov19-Tisochrysis_lutea.AAC.5
MTVRALSIASLPVFLCTLFWASCQRLSKLFKVLTVLVMDLIPLLPTYRCSRSVVILGVLDVVQLLGMQRLQHGLPASIWESYKGYCAKCLPSVGCRTAAEHALTAPWLACKQAHPTVKVLCLDANELHMNRTQFIHGPAQLMRQFMGCMQADARACAQRTSLDAQMECTRGPPSEARLGHSVHGQPKTMVR